MSAAAARGNDPAGELKRNPFAWPFTTPLYVGSALNPINSAITLDRSDSDRPVTKLSPGRSLTGALRRVPLSPVDSAGRAGGGSVMRALKGRPPRAVTPALTGV